MSKTMEVTRIEQQIEALPPVEQIVVLERIIRHLKKLLKPLPVATSHHVASEEVTKQLNDIYAVESSQLDSHLFNAQVAAINRNEWS